MKKENREKGVRGIGEHQSYRDFLQPSAYTQRLTCICISFFLPVATEILLFLDMSFPHHLSEYLLLLSIDSFSLAFQRNQIAGTAKKFTHSHLFKPLPHPSPFEQPSERNHIPSLFQFSLLQLTPLFAIQLLSLPLH